MGDVTREQVHDAVHEALRPWMYPEELSGHEAAAEAFEEAVPDVVDAVAALSVEAPRHVPVEGYWWSTEDGRPYANLGASRSPSDPVDTPLYRLTDAPPEAPQPRVLWSGRDAMHQAAAALLAAVDDVLGAMPRPSRRLSPPATELRALLAEATQRNVHLAAGLEALIGRARRLLDACEDEPLIIHTQSAGEIYAVLDDLTEFVTGVRQGLPVVIQVTETPDLCRVCGEVPAPGGACGPCLAAINEPPVRVGDSVEHVDLGACKVVALGSALPDGLDPDMAYVDFGHAPDGEPTETWVPLADLRHGDTETPA